MNTEERDGLVEVKPLTGKMCVFMCSTAQSETEKEGSSIN